MNKTKRFFVALMLAALAYAGSAGAIPAPLGGYQTHYAYYSDSSYTTLVGTETWACDSAHLFIGRRSGYLVATVNSCGDLPPTD